MGVRDVIDYYSSTFLLGEQHHREKSVCGGNQKESDTDETLTLGSLQRPLLSIVQNSVDLERFGSLRPKHLRFANSVVLATTLLDPTRTQP